MYGTDSRTRKHRYWQLRHHWKVNCNSDAFIVPPTNHFAKGGSHSSVLSQVLNQNRFFACSFQNKIKSESAFFLVIVSLCPRPMRYVLELTPILCIRHF